MRKHVTTTNSDTNKTELLLHVTALKEGVCSISIRRWMRKPEVGKDRLLCEQSNFESFTRGLGSAPSKRKSARKHKWYTALFPCSIKFFELCGKENETCLLPFRTEHYCKIFNYYCYSFCHIRLCFN